MKDFIWLRGAMLLTLSFCFFSSSIANSLPIPRAPETAAVAAVLMDVNSGKWIEENNADEKLPPASITKVMTTYVVLEAMAQELIHIDDKVTISTNAWRTGQGDVSKMFLEERSQVSIGDLLRGLIIQSGADASVALAEHVAGSESSFVDMMNHTAQRLGLSNSHFSNTNGLDDDEHYMSARDIAVLGRRLILDFPEYYPIFSEKDFTHNGIKQPNWNDLLRQNDSVDGIKTGRTDNAKYCLIASAKRNDMRLISVVLGMESKRARDSASMALLNYGFRFYETHKLYSLNQEVTRQRLWKGETESIGLGPVSDIYVTIPRGEYPKLEANMDFATKLIAPIALNERVGQIRVKLGDQEILETPLVTLEEANSGGLWRRLSDSAKLWFD